MFREIATKSDIYFKKHAANFFPRNML